MSTDTRIDENDRRVTERRFVVTDHGGQVVGNGYEQDQRGDSARERSRHTGAAGRTSGRSHDGRWG